MKKISKILIVFILLFLVGITKVSAANIFWRIQSTRPATMKNEGLITYDWYASTNGHDLCSNSTSSSCKEMLSYWNLYSVKVDSKAIYIVYCINPNKDIKHKDPMNSYDSIEDLGFSDGQSHPDRVELLKKLLLYGYNPDPSHTTSLETLVANDPKARLKLIAMQVLVWEVTEGGRTSFDTEAPDWNGEYSFYNQVIYPNGGSNPSQADTLYYYYHQYRNAARLADQANPSPAFNKTDYILSWDSANKRYIETIPGLGDYTTCESNNPNVTVSVDTNNSIATVISNDTVKSATITCKYFRGNGASGSTNTESFKHFTFKNSTKERQDMLAGTGWKIFSKSFNVSSENTDFAIKKVDTEGVLLEKVKFNLTHIKNTSYSVTLESNTTTKYSLNYSGEYRVSEITPPDGYEKLRDFNITIDASTHKITKCDNSKSENGVITSCLNDQVKVSYNSNAIELTIVNVAKNFKIQKVDKAGNAIKGATFEIRDSDNNLVKFTKTKANIFKYDTEGNLTSIYDASLSTYPVSLLPVGDYRIIETAVPYPYRLSLSEKERTTYIKIDSNRNVLVRDNNKNTYSSAPLSTVKIVNYQTELKILKTGNGNPLAGVQFELYNADKSTKLSSNLVSPGIYNYIDNNGNTDVYVTNLEGKININGLPEGTYYLKEIATVEPFVLPQGNGVYTEVVIDIDEKGASINGNHVIDTINISNTPNSFNFYKRDTEGNALTTGKYKLQKYDEKTKKYVDLKLVEVPNDGTYNPNNDIYKVDEKNGKIQFTLKKGAATFIDMESSTTYRIIETVAPEGYTKASTKDTATVHIDEHGNASGLLVLIDQKIVREDDSASAELIINIQTGKQRIMYAAVIFVVFGLIAGLIIYNKRK